MKKLLSLLACAVALQFNAQAITAVDSNNVVWTFVGQFAVGDGPDWTTNPPVYSGIEAAELIFGTLVGGEYAISVENNFVTHTARLDGWSDTQYLTNPQPEDWKLDTGNPGYNDPAGFGTAYSAYVRDHSGPGQFINYVFSREVVATPEIASTLALFGLSLAGMSLARRKLS